jgi:hypothetical protein
VIFASEDVLATIGVRLVGAISVAHTAVELAGERPVGGIDCLSAERRNRMNDTEFMRIAIEESKKGDWPYGAVIVRDGAIVVKGFNTATRDRDTTAHAEINVIRAAPGSTPTVRAQASQRQHGDSDGQTHQHDRSGVADPFGVTGQHGDVQRRGQSCAEQLSWSFSTAGVPCRSGTD